VQGAIHTSLRIISFGAALACFYAALLLYPDEQGRIQNRLEEWWVAFDDRQRAALSKGATFMRGVATLADNGFTSVFGPALISFRSLAASIWFSSLSFAFYILFWDSISLFSVDAFTFLLMMVFLSVAFWATWMRF
jgi:hypothetical protein